MAQCWVCMDSGQVFMYGCQHGLGSLISAPWSCCSGVACWQAGGESPVGGRGVRG